jgi:hypothetical protein
LAGVPSSSMVQVPLGPVEMSTVKATSLSLS